MGIGIVSLFFFNVIYIVFTYYYCDICHITSVEYMFCAQNCHSVVFIRRPLMVWHYFFNDRSEIVIIFEVRVFRYYVDLVHRGYSG